MRKIKVSRTRVMAIRRVMSVAASIFVFVFVIYTAARFASFLSWSYSSSRTAAIQMSHSPLMCTLWDVGLALQFCFQHSVLCWPKVCRALESVCGVLSRSVYLLASCLSLKLLILLWLPVDSHILWAIEEGSPLWWTLPATHGVCWAVIYIGCVITDLGELAGIKQVWYSAESSRYTSSKSWQLEHLLQHMRHPSFVALSVILWFYPLMTLDRAVLALTFTLYPFGWFKAQVKDYEYCHCFWRSKLADLFPKAASQ
ncbi:nurim homolog isoform X1 [Dermacentor silvarum]|uniref:nurim homolog isoform X1 n=2 Tax=Dermacentor silvarum TaxID=543639 RepID=UPI001896D917|nr:nurim homolog isoform X1 [Dermacentor silvarum]